MNALLQRLRAEIADDLRAFWACVGELDDLDLDQDPADPGDLARAAIALHHGYGAVEALLQRVSSVLEGQAPTGPGWHRELLVSMGLDIEAVRPAVLTTQTRDLLFELLAFRHFFRHAYVARLDRARLETLRATLRALAPRLHADVERLDRFLATLAEQDAGLPR